MARDFDMSIDLGGQRIIVDFKTGTVIFCPYCNQPMRSTFNHSDPEERELLGEHCDRCFLPFEIDEHGPLGQNGERPTRTS